MRTVLRYDSQGHKVWSPNEPARGVMQGHGGQAIGTSDGTTLVAKSPDKRPEGKTKQEGPR